MAFSIKGLLALTGYAALAAAAIATGHWAFVDILWAVTFGAIAYATIIALFARGPRQRIAGGFAVASLLLLACLGLSPDSIPTARLIVIAAAGQQPPAPRQVSPLYTSTMSPPESDDQVLITGGGSFGGGSGFGGGTSISYVEQLEWIAAYRAANAAATMLAGLAGCALAAVAQRRIQRDEQ